MKLAATIARSLQTDMQAELRDLKQAVATGTGDAGRGLKTELRRQVASAGLGQRLANSWRTSTPRTRSSTRPAWFTPRRRRSCAPSTRAR
jgi:Family of unknown function (DUF6441)